MLGLNVEAEKRGRLVNQATGEDTHLVLRQGTLRIYGCTTQRRRRLADCTVQVAYKCEVTVQAGCQLVIDARTPRDAKYVLRAADEADAAAWQKALQVSLTETVARLQRHLQLLAEGSTGYKYNYSNSKRMRRHFWVNESRVELCWGKSKGDEPQTMDLSDCVGIIYGPETTTFQRCSAMEDPPWCCFSLLFPDRTLDLAVPATIIDTWFLGLQHLLLTRTPKCASGLSESQFVFRKVWHKLRDAAQKQGLITRISVLRQLKQLSRDLGFREELSKLRRGGSMSRARALTTAAPAKAVAVASLADLEAEAKAERRRKRKESKMDGRSDAAEEDVTESRRFSALPKVSAVDGSSPNGASREREHREREQREQREQEEEALRQTVSDLELELETMAAKLTTLQPAWAGQLAAVLRMDALEDVLRSEGVSWQAEKCAELEGESLTLRTAGLALSRQLQVAEKVEKQMKKLAKQIKESEAQVQAMEQELGSAEAGARNSESAKYSSSAALERTAAQTSHLERRARELEQQLQPKSGADLAVLQEQNRRQSEELARLEREKVELEKRLQVATADFAATERRQQEDERRLAAAAGASRKLRDFLRGLGASVNSLKAQQQRTRAECDMQLRSIADAFLPLGSAVQKIGASTDHLIERYREVAEERKKLHNLVLELKGNIRVFVRVRPMNEKEKAAEPSGEQTVTFAEDCKVSVYDANQTRRKWFEFDKAFAPKASQVEVFEEVKALATSVLDGYNVCIFAYGQTGSGKTFTMTGNENNPGLNVRVLMELFRLRDERRVETDIKISIMITEIYNETIKDLLVTKQKKLDVKSNADGTNTVPGLTELAVDTVEDVLKAMTEAQANRTVMATDMNDESSRSHSIVQVRTVNTSNKDRREFTGKINLIDLAGSENVNKSGVSGDGLREAQNINKSLSALGDVIQALVAKSPHVPYRNSKLTMLLKDSLGGDAKTLMIVQSSPAQLNVTETLSSLNFSARARNVELGKAKRNVKTGE